MITEGKCYKSSTTPILPGDLVNISDKSGSDGLFVQSMKGAVIVETVNLKGRIFNEVKVIGRCPCAGTGCGFFIIKLPYPYKEVVCLTDFMNFVKRGD